MESEKVLAVVIDETSFRKILNEEVEKVIRVIKTQEEELVLLRKEELAELFKVTTETIGQWVKSGAVPKPSKINKVPYWTQEEIRKFLKKR